MQRLTVHLRTCVNMCVKDRVSFFQIKQSSECLVALPSLPVLLPNNHQTIRHVKEVKAWLKRLQETVPAFVNYILIEALMHCLLMKSYT